VLIAKCACGWNAKAYENLLSARSPEERLVDRVNTHVRRNPRHMVQLFNDGRTTWED
jgi:hypothetical protein